MTIDFVKELDGRLKRRFFLVAVEDGFSRFEFDRGGGVLVDDFPLMP